MVMKAVFWQPLNSIGTAATVDTLYGEEPVKINFYWSAIDLATDPKGEDELRAQISEFFIEHPLTNPDGKNTFHVIRRGDRFGEITDPAWMAPAVNV